ncbi:MAG: PAS domain S-box protein, partial [Methanomicrobiales archaeon HGW-Methanomicrobiales-5]
QYANPATISFLGIPENKITGISIAPFIAPEDQGTSTKVIEKIKNNSVPTPPREIFIHSSDGTKHTCIITSVPVQFRDSSSILSVLTDITEQKLVENALRTANKKLNLLSSITRHDIRNQLMALKKYLELSQDVVDEPPQMTEFVLKEKKIADTIERQINFTQAYEDLGVHAPTWQNVNTILQNVVTTLPMREVHIEIDRMDLEVFADPLFEKVFYNLTDNAIRYGGELMKNIRISSIKRGEELIILFEDDGKGIPDADKAHIFKKGFGSNTGLGLFLSHDILSITDITIAETGVYGKGARFAMVVPGGEYRFTRTGKI